MPISQWNTALTAVSLSLKCSIISVIMYFILNSLMVITLPQSYIIASYSALTVDLTVDLNIFSIYLHLPKLSFPCTCTQLLCYCPVFHASINGLLDIPVCDWRAG